MFGFLDMTGTYESRKVARYEVGDLIISTCSVTDGAHPYETAVAHPEYNGGEFVIVEAYDNHEDAHTGHKRWVKTMTSDALPDKLVDCNNSEIQRFASALGGRTEYLRQKN